MWPSWKGLRIQWNGDRVQRRVRLKRIYMIRRGLRIAPGKVKRRGLHCLPLVSILVFSSKFFILFCCL